MDDSTIAADFALMIEHARKLKPCKPQEWRLYETMKIRNIQGKY